MERKKISFSNPYRDTKIPFYEYTTQTQISPDYVHDKTPHWSTMLLLKKWMGFSLLVVGLAGLIRFSFVSESTTILTNQLIQPGQWVGHINEIPRTVVVAHVSPLLVSSIGSVLAGIIHIVTVRIDHVTNEYFKTCDMYAARYAYYHICLQTVFVVVVILPLAGVVNMFEFLFATALSLAESLMFLLSDIVNALALNCWEIVDLAKDKYEDHEKTYSYVMGQRGFFQYSYEPIVTAIILHAFVWIIIFIHMGFALQSNSYGIAPSLVFLVISSFFLQLLVPIIKILQITRTMMIFFFGMYKYVLISIEIIQFFNMALTTMVLIINYR